MKLIKTELDGVLIIELDKHSDARGSLTETWHLETYGGLGIRKDFVQDNMTFSAKGVLRGLHFQNPYPQAKLISVPQGEIFDVAVDIRAGSSTFGKWFGATLSDENCRQMYIAEGFAHGFVVLSDSAIVLYKCTGFYRKESEKTLRWNDPSVGITWPFTTPVLSDKDAHGLLLTEMPAADLFKFAVPHR